MATNIPYPGTEICGCDDDALCGFHADQLLQRIQEPSISVPNAHVEPSFRDILNGLLEDSKRDANVRAAVLTLWGDGVFPDAEIRQLAKMDAREVYREE